MSFCQGCGKQLVEGSRFCDVCGRAVPSTEAEVPSAPGDAPQGQTAPSQPVVEPIAPPPPVVQPDASTQPVAVPPTPKKGGVGLVLVIVGVVLAALLVVCVGGYFAYEAMTGPTVESYTAEVTPVFEDLQRLAEDIEAFQQGGTVYEGDDFIRAAEGWARDAAAIRDAAGAATPPDEMQADHDALYMYVYSIADAFESLSVALSEDGDPLDPADEAQLLSDLDFAWESFMDAEGLADRLGIVVMMPDMAEVGRSLVEGMQQPPPPPVIIDDESWGVPVPLDDPDLVEDMTEFARENVAQGVSFKLTVMDTADAAEGGSYALGVAEIGGGDAAWITMRFERDYWVGLDFGSGIDPGDTVPEDVADQFRETMNPGD